MSRSDGTMPPELRVREPSWDESLESDREASRHRRRVRRVHRSQQKEWLRQHVDDELSIDAYQPAPDTLNKPVLLSGFDALMCPNAGEHVVDVMLDHRYDERDRVIGTVIWTIIMRSDGTRELVYCWG